jgi:hypothetical protein
MTFSVRMATDEIHALAIKVRDDFHHAPDLAEVWSTFGGSVLARWTKQPRGE